MTSRRPPWPVPGRSIVSVGLFDGVHRGHAALLEQLRRQADAMGGEAVAVTFHPHPAALLTGRSPLLVVSPDHRVRLIQDLGIDRVWLMDLDRSFLAMAASDFLREFLCRQLNAVGLVVGFNNKLGSDQADFAQLQGLGMPLGLSVFQAPPFLVSGRPVSSTMVRDAVTGGDLALARRLLGRPVSFMGRIVPGRGVGTTLGFPTANLVIEYEAVVPCGVYAGQVTLAGRRCPAAVNIGHCPTFDDRPDEPARGPYVQGKHVIEIHVLDYDGDLAGAELIVSLLGKLREEQRFPDRAALTAQIQRDVDQVRRLAPETGEGHPKH